MEKGYIHIYTGDGKGKTTAALGLALRAAGAGFKVWIGQFAKGIEYSEHSALKRFDDLIAIKQFGKSCFIHDRPEQEDIKMALHGLEEAKKVMTKGEYQIVILDEACIALHFNLFTVKALLKAINKRARHVEVIITGRNAPEELINAADLVTEMKEIKHYYNKGVNARDGIEK
jgi:cob(I)alamin adenosyltransferase